MPDWTQVLTQCEGLAQQPDQLAQLLWSTPRALSPGFTHSLDERVPAWREHVGPHLALLFLARAGRLEPWIDLAALPLGELGEPQRQRLVRWLIQQAKARAPLAPWPLPDHSPAPIIDALCEQCITKHQNQAHLRGLLWLQMRHATPERLKQYRAMLWSSDTQLHLREPILDALLGADSPQSYALALVVMTHHPLRPLRKIARAHQARWAQAASLSPAAIFDQIILRWPDDLGGPVDAAAVTKKQLEMALRLGTSRPASELREVICQPEHPLAPTLRALLWCDELGRWGTLDARGQLRGWDEEVIEARQLQLAHPALPCPKASPQSWSTRVAPDQQLIPQLEREVFGMEALEAGDEDAPWVKPVWRFERPLTVWKVLRRLRDRFGWRLPKPEGFGWIAGAYRSFEQTEQTIICRFMDAHDRPNYGYAMHGHHLQRLPEARFSYGLIVLRRPVISVSRIDSYAWPPHNYSWGITPDDIIPIEEASPKSLSEALRDLYLAGKP